MGFPACSNRLSRTVEKPFPCYRKCISTLSFRQYLDIQEVMFLYLKTAYTEAEWLPSGFGRFSATLRRMNIHSFIIILHEYAFLLCVSSSAFPLLGSPFFPFHRGCLVVLLVFYYDTFVSFFISVHSLSFVLRMICCHFPAYCCCMVVLCLSPRQLVLL